MLWFILSLEGRRRKTACTQRASVYPEDEGPLKEAFSSFCCIFPQPVQPVSIRPAPRTFSIPARPYSCRAEHCSTPALSAHTRQHVKIIPFSGLRFRT